jgi:hypothetical protein
MLFMNAPLGARLRAAEDCKLHQRVPRAHAARAVMGRRRAPLFASGPRPQARSDYLLYWMKPVCLKVPFLTSGSPADAGPGAIGQPNTNLLVGSSRFEFSGASGV